MEGSRQKGKRKMKKYLDNTKRKIKIIKFRMKERPMNCEWSTCVPIEISEERYRVTWRTISIQFNSNNIETYLILNQGRENFSRPIIK